MLLASVNEHKDFLLSYGNDLALYAYRSYQKQGRGFILGVVPDHSLSYEMLEFCRVSMSEVGEAVRLAYLTLDQFSGSPFEKVEPGLKSVLARYIPEEELVLVLPLAGGLVPYHFRCEPVTPKAAYEEYVASQEQIQPEGSSQVFTTAEDQLGFVRQCFHEIGAFAYGHYKRSGRGLVVFLSGAAAQELLANRSTNGFGDQLLQLNDHNVVLWGTRHGFKQSIEQVDSAFYHQAIRLIDHYEPNLQVVVHLELPEHSHIVVVDFPDVPHLSPKELFKARKKRG